MTTPQSSSGSQICKNCGSINSTGSKFCKKCGASLQILEACPQCGKELDPDAVFCPQCRAKVGEEMEVLPRPISVRRLPLGLEILIVFGGLGAAFYFYSAIMVFYATALFPIDPGFLSLIGALWLLVAAFLAVVSWGLWNLKEWARKALLVNCVLSIFGAFFEIILGLLALIYSIIILWYISRAHIRTLFQVGRVSPIEAPGLRAQIPRYVCPSCGKKGKPGAKFCVKCGTKLEEVV